MKKILLLVLCIISLLVKSQAPDWTWTKIIGGNNDDRPTKVTVDNNGDCILGWYFFSDSITIGNELYYSDGYCDIILIKFDSSGSILWSKSFHSNRYEFIEDISVDTNNNIYIVGTFNGDSLLLDSVTLVNSSTLHRFDSFVAKLSPDGNIICSSSFGGEGNERAYNIVVDEFGNYYIGGNFANGNLHIEDTVILASQSNTEDFFLLKFNSINELAWVKRSSYGNHQNRLNGMCFSSDNYIYLSGIFFSDSIQFDTCQINAFNDGGFFLVKYDTNGNIIFANNYGYYDEYTSTTGSIVSDNNNNIIMSGSYWGSHLIFNNDTLISQGGQDFFTCKFNSEGTPIWVTGSGFNGSDRSKSVVTDLEDNIYITGSLQSGKPTGDTIYFNDSVYITIHMVGQFIAKYNSDGNTLWAKTNSIPTTSLTEGTSIAIDFQGNIYSTGWFTGSSITFGNQTYPSNGSFDTYLVKIEQQLFLPQPNSPTGQTDVCNNDVVEYTTSYISGASYYQWEVLPAEAGVISGDSLVGTFYADATWTGSFSIRVRAMNNNYTGDWSEELQVELNIVPSPFFITGQGPYCEGGLGSEPILEDSEIGVDYDLYLNNVATGIVVPGTGSAISFGYVTEEGIYTAVGYSSDYCVSVMWGDLWIYMIELPEQPGIPNGPEVVCNNDEYQYFSSGSINSDTLLWNLSPSEAGEIISFGNEITIIWNNTFLGYAYLVCSGMNECGEGIVSNALEINVHNSPTPEISGLTLVCKNNSADYETDYNAGTTYSWNVSGGEIIAGVGTNLVTISWGEPGSGYINLLETNAADCEKQTDDFTVTIDECLGIISQHNESFSFIPNPTRDRILIKSNENMLTISVLDLIGNVVTKRKTINKNEIKLDLSGLESGIYLFRIQGENTEGIYKVVKL